MNDIGSNDESIHPSHVWIHVGINKTDSFMDNKGTRLAKHDMGMKRE